MRRIFFFLATLAAGLGCWAQEPVLTFSGELYFIPGAMTKDGEAFLYSVDTPCAFTVFDGNLKEIKSYKEEESVTYKSRQVCMTRLLDPETKEFLTEWVVNEDMTYESNDSSPSLCGFEMYADDNTYHSRFVYLSQTLFDDDEEFEFLRQHKELIPIDVKTADYYAEHSTGGIDGGHTVSPDNFWNQFGADGGEYIWSEEFGRVIQLYKYESYGGAFYGDLEIVSLDGKVKGRFPGITSVSMVYYYRGKCYVQGYSPADNSSALFSLDPKTSEIKEVQRKKAELSARRIGDNLVVEGAGGRDETIVISSASGQVLRNVPVSSPRVEIPLGNLANGVYTVTLYRHGSPLRSSKMLLR